MASIRENGGAYFPVLSALASMKPPRLKYSEGMSVLLRIQEPQLDGLLDLRRVC